MVQQALAVQVHCTPRSLNGTSRRGSLEEGGESAAMAKDGGGCEGTVPVVMGFPIKGHRTMQLGVLALGSLVSAVGFSTLQERVFKIPGFSFGGWMTVCTYITFLLCACFERVLTGDTKRRASYKDFAMVSVLTLSGLYLTNTSLKYLDYSTRVVFKSSKVIPTMAFGVVVMRRRYSWQQYCAALLLVLGISLFTLGDKDLSPSFSFVGVALISVALVCDGLTGNMEERLFFRKADPCSEAEVILFTSAFSLVGGVAVAAATGELAPAAQHSLDNPITVPYIVASACLGYVSVSFILALIQHFDATTAEIVKSLRKVLQVVMSFLVFHKSVNAKIIYGGLLVAGALFWFQQCARKGTQHGGGGGGEARGHGSGDAEGDVEKVALCTSSPPQGEVDRRRAAEPTP